MLYVAKVRENQKTMSVSDSVKKTVDDCIREGILEKFFKKYKAEAIEVSIFEYDEEKHMKFVREEGREEGRTEGMLAGIKVLITDNLEEGISPERIVEKLVRHYSLSEEAAKRYLEEYILKV